MELTSTETTTGSEVEYRKIPKFSDAKNFAVIYLKFKQRGQTIAYFVKKMQME